MSSKKGTLLVGVDRQGKEFFSHYLGYKEGSRVHTRNTNIDTKDA